MLVYLYSADTQCHHRFLSTEICYQPYYYTKCSALTQENLTDSKIENVERRVDAGACGRGGLYRMQMGIGLRIGNLRQHVQSP